MNQQRQIELLEILANHTLENTIGMSEKESLRSTECYRNPEILGREIQVLFKRQPLLLCFSSQIQNPGDFITRQVLNMPILLTRNQSGQAKGFFNVCRHRAACVVSEASGQGQKSFACPYHGWTYNTDGQLIHIPRPEGFPSIATRMLSLVEFPVMEVQGLIFGQLEGKLSGISPLYPLEDELSGFSFSKHRIFKNMQIRARSNWKQTVEQFLEVYHFKFIHRNSIRSFFVDFVQHSERHEKHVFFSFARKNIREILAQDKSTWQIREVANLIYLIAPNTLLLIQQDHIIVATIWPKGPDQTVVDYALLIPDDTPDERLEYYELNHQIVWVTIHEDIANGDLVQRGLNTPELSHVRFGRYEQAIQYFHQVIDEELKRHPTAL